MLLQHWKLRDWKGIKFKVRRPTLRVAFLANAVIVASCPQFFPLPGTVIHDSCKALSGMTVQMVTAEELLFT